VSEVWCNGTIVESGGGGSARESIAIVKTFEISLEAREHSHIEGDFDRIPHLSCIPLVVMDFARR
jgi:hypothetical protein